MKNINFKISFLFLVLIAGIVLWKNVQARTNTIQSSISTINTTTATQVGLQYHLFDANNQDLGIFLGNNPYKQVIIPNLNLITNIDDNTTNSTTNYYTNQNLISVEFTGLNCIGDKFTSSLDKNIKLLFGSDGNYYKIVTNTPLVNRVALSHIDNGVCENFVIPSGGNDSYLIDQITQPITNPILLPLHLGLK